MLRQRSGFSAKLSATDGAVQPMTNDYTTPNCTIVFGDIVFLCLGMGLLIGVDVLVFTNFTFGSRYNTATQSLSNEEPIATNGTNGTYDASRSMRRGTWSTLLDSCPF